MMLSQTDVLTRIDKLTQTRLEVCISHAWIAPHHSETGPMFDALDLARLQLIVDLTEDMAVNDDAVPIILSLVDQLHALRGRLHALDHAVTDQDDAVAEAIATRLADLIGHD